MSWVSQRSTILYSVLAAFLLLVFSFSLWFYKDIFNKTNFQQHVSRALSTDESRDALASLIIDQGFQKRPVIKSILLEQAQPALAGALDGPRVQNVFTFFITSFHESLFSQHPRAIVLELSGIKSFVENLFFLVEMISDNQIGDTTIPDTIVLIREGEIPSILTFSRVILALGPLVVLLALGIVIWLIVRTNNKSITIQIIGATLALFSVLSILLIKWYQPLLLSNFQNSYARIVAEEVFGELSKPLIFQNLLLALIGVIAVFGSMFFQRMEKRRLGTKSPQNK